MKFFKIIILVALAVRFPVFGQDPPPPGLTAVEGIKVGKGNIRVGVFDEAHRKEFPEGEHLLGVEAPADEDMIDRTERAVNVAGEFACAKARVQGCPHGDQDLCW